MGIQIIYSTQQRLLDLVYFLMIHFLRKVCKGTIYYWFSEIFLNILSLANPIFLSIIFEHHHINIVTSIIKPIYILIIFCIFLHKAQRRIKSGEDFYKKTIKICKRLIPISGNRLINIRSILPFKFCPAPLVCMPIKITNNIIK